MENKVFELRKTARFAGLFYLIMTIAGVYNLIYLPSKIILKGDPAVVADNILSQEFLFRTSIIVDFISNIAFLFMVIFLYKVLKHVNQHRAKLMAALVIVQIPAVYIIEALNITALYVLKGKIFTALDISQSQDLAMLLLNINDYFVIALQVFWGLWLIPLAQLVYKSGLIPRIIGVLLMINGIAYMFDSFIFMLLPAYHAFVNQFLLLFVIPGEISLMLWLLIKGVRYNEPVIKKQ